MDFLNPTRYRGPLRAVVLDWAGTAVDFGCCDPVAAFAEVFRREGVEVSVAEARGPMGTHKRDHIATMTRMPEVAARWRDVHGADPDDAAIDRMYAALTPALLAVLPDYSAIVPGLVGALEAFRARDLLVGSTTGYSSEMMAPVVEAAARQGYVPDAWVTPDQVGGQGRPAPFMAFENARRLGVWTMAAIVKIGDTVPDIEEGRNAGMWTVAVAATGNEVGVTEADFAALRPDERAARLQQARARLAAAGPHVVLDGIDEIGPVLDAISERVANGVRP